MSILTIGLVIYGVIALLALRPVVGHFAWEEKYDGNIHPTCDDWVIGFWKGLFTVGLWPVLLIVFTSTVLANRTMPTIGAEREAERKMREKRLREAEREVGLDQ